MEEAYDHTGKTAGDWCRHVAEGQKKSIALARSRNDPFHEGYFFGCYRACLEQAEKFDEEDRVYHSKR